MITEDYVSFETAKLLKEKGFDGGCRARYGTAGSFSYERFEIEESDREMYNAILAPTLQMAMKWLREKYNLFPVVEPFLTEETKPKYWVNVIWCNSIPKYSESKRNYYTPEQALEAILKYCLENLI
jgi:hypothetical protein